MKPASLPRRVLQTFVAPRRLFAGFGPYTPWLGALLVTTLVAVLASAAIPDAVFVEQTRGATDRLGRPVVVTSDPATIGTWGRLMTALSALMFQPMLAFGLAGLLALVFGTRPRRLVDYAQYLAVTTHALLIPAFGTLLLAAVEFRQFGGPGATVARIAFAVWGVGVALLGARVLPSARTVETSLDSTS